LEQVIASAAKQSPVGMGILPILNRQAGCLSHQSREARDRLDPGSESGVTHDRQSRVPRGTVPLMKLLSRGTRDFTPRNIRVSNADKKTPTSAVTQLLDSKVFVFLQEANRLFQSVSAERLSQDFRTSIDNRVDNRGFA
jgi:hypothetical protein